MKSWLKYFFGGFWSSRLSQQCQWRSLGNTALGALLSFLLLICGLTWGYQASFGPTYQRAEEFRQFLYSTMDTIDFTVTDGVATGESRINTYGEKQEVYRLIVDLRDTRSIYDAFALSCTAENGQTISYESYLVQPAHVQKAYTKFTVTYSGEELNLTEKCPEYLAYLQTLSDPQSLLYNEETAENLQKLEAEKPEDYYEQVYLLYVSSYYPKLEMAEFNSKAPTIHGYYLDLLSRDTEGKFLCLLKDNCYVGFQSGGMQVIYTGNYSQIQSMEAGAAGADTLIYKSFESNGQTDYLMYAVNIFGGFFLIVVLWLLMMIVVRIVCRIKRYEVATTFGSAAQLVGSFLLWSGGIAALCGFILSFMLDQALVFYGAIGIMALVLVIRTIVFMARQNPAENG